MCHLTQTWNHHRQDNTGRQKPAEGGITMCFLEPNFCEHFKTNISKCGPLNLSIRAVYISARFNLNMVFFQKTFLHHNIG